MNLFLTMSVFVKIVDSGSLYGASVELNISPTMVGKHLRMLESHLNFRLLNRTTRRISLTQEGENYFNHCKEVLSLVESGEERFRKNHPSLSNNIIVSAPEVLGKHLILPIILKYMEHHPDINIELELSDSFIDLTTSKIDIAIRVGEVPDSNEIISKYLGDYEFVACASPKYLKESGTPINPDDLLDHQCISFNKKILNEWQGNEFVEKMKKSRIVSFSIDAIRMSALSGLGVIIHSKIFVEDDIKNGKLLAILEDHPLPRRKISAIYHKDKKNNKKVKKLIEFIQLHTADVIQG